VTLEAPSDSYTVSMLPARFQDATRQRVRREKGLISERGSNWVYAQRRRKRKPQACGQVTDFVGDVELLDTFRRDDTLTTALVGGLNRAPEMAQHQRP
jgi:hypothetical protein